MDETYIQIRGIDPLLFRDGRPFSNELGSLTADTLPLPLPGTVAGFLRTHIGNGEKWMWEGDASVHDNARRIAVHSPLLQRDDTIVFPAPRDAVVYGVEKDRAVMRLSPMKSMANGSGCDLPDGLLPLQITENVKPATGYRYWSQPDMERWLLPQEGNTAPSENITGPPTDERIHIAVNAETGTAEESRLYRVAYLSFLHRQKEQQGKDSQAAKQAVTAEWSLLARVGRDSLPNGVGHFGGERRVAHIQHGNTFPSCPPALKTALQKSQRLRLILATPALFTNGWLPGWLDPKTLTGTLPDTGISLRLVSAATGRREAVSGWSFQNRRPRKVRWCVPAGSVYFLETTTNTDLTPIIEKYWLRPVSDEQQDKRDGYGLALWGTW